MMKRLAWCMLMAVGSAAPAHAERLAVAFPPGWDISELPGPTVDGVVVPGDRRRAILPGPDGKPRAAIELTELPRTDPRTIPLRDALQSAQEAATQAYAAAKLDNGCGAQAPIQAGASDALRIDCTVARGGAAVLHQVVVMWMTKEWLYSLSYSAPTSSGTLGQAEFYHLLATIGVP